MKNATKNSNWFSSNSILPIVLSFLNLTILFWTFFVRGFKFDLDITKEAIFKSSHRARIEPHESKWRNINFSDGAQKVGLIET